MSVHEFELFHGIALTKLVRSDRPITLRMIETQPSDAWAAYTINLDVLLLIKYSTTFRSLKRQPGRAWTFVFSPAETRCVREGRKKEGSFAALVCANRVLDATAMAVCLLDPSDVECHLDLSGSTQQSVTVRLHPSKSLRVVSNRGGETVVPRNRLEVWQVPGS